MAADKEKQNGDAAALIECKVDFDPYGGIADDEVDMQPNEEVNIEADEEAQEEEEEDEDEEPDSVVEPEGIDNCAIESPYLLLDEMAFTGEVGTRSERGDRCDVIEIGDSDGEADEYQNPPRNSSKPLLAANGPRPKVPRLVPPPPQFKHDRDVCTNRFPNGMDQLQQAKFDELPPPAATLCLHSRQLRALLIDKACSELSLDYAGLIGRLLWLQDSGIAGLRSDENLGSTPGHILGKRKDEEAADAAIALAVGPSDEKGTQPLQRWNDNEHQATPATSSRGRRSERRHDKARRQEEKGGDLELLRKSALNCVRRVAEAEVMATHLEDREKMLGAAIEDAGDEIASTRQQLVYARTRREALLLELKAIVL